MMAVDRTNSLSELAGSLREAVEAVAGGEAVVVDVRVLASDYPGASSEQRDDDS